MGISSIRHWHKSPHTFLMRISRIWSWSYDVVDVLFSSVPLHATTTSQAVCSAAGVVQLLIGPLADVVAAILHLLHLSAALQP